MRRLVFAVIVSIVALAMLAIGGSRKLPVYEEDVGTDEFAFFEEIPETTLVFDATFSGVKRSELTGRLISTYDRSQPRTRAACPT